MWPWGHLAVGYLCYVVSIKLRGEGKQTLATLLAVAVGSQFPDLVDKPLAWSVAVLPSGRSLAHSLITAVLVLGVGYWVGQQLHRKEGVLAFGIGYVSHSLVDLGPSVILELLRGNLSQLQWMIYLLWPLLPSPPYPHDNSFNEHFAALVLDPFMGVQFALVGVAIVVWVFSGSPGVREARQIVQNRLRHRM